jgi:hypothetical protein
MITERRTLPSFVADCTPKPMRADFQVTHQSIFSQKRELTWLCGWNKLPNATLTESPGA